MIIYCYLSFLLPISFPQARIICVLNCIQNKIFLRSLYGHPTKERHHYDYRHGVCWNCLVVWPVHQLFVQLTMVVVDVVVEVLLFCLCFRTAHNNALMCVSSDRDLL